MSAEITICIPTYNPRFSELVALLSSIADQDLVPSAVVISQEPVHSGTTLRADDLPRLSIPLRIELNSVRLGMVGNWNRSVEMAETDLVIVCGQDDVLTPDACSTHAAVLSAATKAGMSSSTPGFINASGASIKSNVRSVRPNRLFEPNRLYELPYSLYVDLALLYGNVTGEPCGSCFRLSAWHDVGGYSEKFQHSADLEFGLRVARHSGSAMLSTRQLSRRRLHDANASADHIASGDTSRDRYQLVTAFKGDTSSPYVAARAEARALTHDLFDVVRTKGRRFHIDPRSLRSTSPRAVIADVWENLGGRPFGKRLLER